MSKMKTIQIVFKVDFNRYDEDIISIISGHTRYFFTASKADEAIGDWTSKSNRNEATTEIIEVE